jgi:hypothetical protein
LSDVTLADPNFGLPSRIDLLLGVDVFTAVILQGRRQGPPGSPTAFETKLGWTLAGSTNSTSPNPSIVTHHISLLTGDDLLRKFWEIEENPLDKPVLSPDESAAIKHFEVHHRRHSDGRFMVPLPKKPSAKPLGESRSQAVRRFISFERAVPFTPRNSLVSSNLSLMNILTCTMPT